MHRTTLEFDDNLFRQVKQEAAKRGVSLKEFISNMIREGLGRAKKTEKFQLTWKPIKGKLPPRIDVADRDSLYDLLDTPQ